MKQPREPANHVPLTGLLARQGTAGRQAGRQGTARHKLIPHQQPTRGITIQDWIVGPAHGLRDRGWMPGRAPRPTSALLRQYLARAIHGIAEHIRTWFRGDEHALPSSGRAAPSADRHRERTVPPPGIVEFGVQSCTDRADGAMPLEAAFSRPRALPTAVAPEPSPVCHRRFIAIPPRERKEAGDGTVDGEAADRGSPAPCRRLSVKWDPAQADPHGEGEQEVSPID